MLGQQKSMLGGGKQSMLEQAAIQEEAAPAEATSTESPAEQSEGDFEGLMQGIEMLQAGVQDVLSTMIDIEAQTVKDPEAIASFISDMGNVLAKYQGGGEEAAPAEAAPVEG